MTATRATYTQTASAEVPPVPLTVEGYSVLHQMMRFKWSAWRSLRPGFKTEIVHEAAGLLSKMEQNGTGQSALYSVLGHTWTGGPPFLNRFCELTSTEGAPPFAVFEGWEGTI